MKALLTVLMAAAPVPAMAAPVNLTCTLDDRGKAVPMELALNEDASTVSFHWPVNGSRGVQRAVFLPTEVTFMSFKIDRRSLKVERVNDRYDQEKLGKPPVTTGTCELVKVDRAF